MDLPFTTEQFLGVFREYNTASWPAQVAVYLLGLGAIGLTLRQWFWLDRIIGGVLVVCWTTGRVPGWLLVLPTLWALIGYTAAFTLGIVEDTGLLIAGLLGTALLLFRNRSEAEREELNPSVENTT